MDESEYDTEMSETDEVAQPMVVSKREVDEQMKSVMKDFEVKMLLFWCICYINFTGNNSKATCLYREMLIKIVGLISSNV